MTEAVVGVDLVELQLRVAAGESLAGILHQEDLEPKGHAFEARLYAENPNKNFLPAGGKVLRWKPPPESTFFSFSPTTSQRDQSKTLEGSSVPSSTADMATQALGDVPSAVPFCSIRVDSGVREGDVVGVNYDPMIAKVVVKGPDRATALQGLRDALGSLQVAGMPTNAEFVRKVALNQEFRRGGVDTSFISRHEEELLAPQEMNSGVAVLVAAVYTAIDSSSNFTNVSRGNASLSFDAYTTGSSGLGPWNMADSFRVNYFHELGVSFVHAGSGQAVQVAVRRESHGTISVRGQDGHQKQHPLLASISALQIGKDSLSGEVSGRMYKGSWCRHM